MIGGIMGIKRRIMLFQTFGQKFVGQNFSSEKVRQDKISSILFEEFLSDKASKCFSEIPSRTKFCSTKLKKFRLSDETFV